MVFFTCTHCGEALKKPRVEKHFQFQCRNSISVSCMDCFKDFRGQEYVAHTKCITEAERYGGKDFVARPSKNKGERKQQDWILMVQSVIENSKGLTSAEKNILNILSSRENVPKKKAKFVNFIKSVLAGRVDMNVIESVWGKLEEAYNRASESKTIKENSEGGLLVRLSATEGLIVPSNQADVVENENNENLSKEYERAESSAKENGKSDDIENSEMISEEADDGTKRKSKKSKKRKMDEVPETLEESSDSKSKTEEKSENDSTCLVEVEQNGMARKKSKKRKTDNESESLSTTAADAGQNNCENIAANGEASIIKFDWSDAILKIVGSKEEISLKKLRKKILAEYQTSSNRTITEEKATAKFDRKINKMSQIIVVNGKVKLVP